MNDEKIIERIGKLLRLAAPSSGTTVSERTNAALEAARLIDEHGVAMQSTKSEGSSNGAPKRSTVSHGVWVLTQALDRCACSKCGQLISPRDVVWMRVVNLQREFRHNAGFCRVA